MIHKVIRHSLFFALSLYLFTLANAQTKKEQDEFKEMYDDLWKWMVVPACIFVFVGCCLACCVNETAGVIIGFIGVMISLLVPQMILLFISWGYGPYIYPTANTAGISKIFGILTFIVLVLAIVFGIYIITTDNSGKFRGCPKINFTNCFNRCFDRCTKCFDQKSTKYASTDRTDENRTDEITLSETYRQLRFNII